jgi:AGZA family xanthine/uracil permease-like MFS transporter
MPQTTMGNTGAIQRFFHLEERGTTVSRELLGGLTTFAAMSYILTVNPQIMSAAGMDRTDMIMATAIISALGTLLIGLLSNLPLALAPGMGANIVFVYTVVKAAGIPWRAGLAMVSLTGVVFLLLSVSQLREKIANQVPGTIKVGIQAAVGTLIVFIGLRGAGVIVANPNTMTAVGALSSPAVLLTLAGILVTLAMVALRIAGALIVSIVGLTATGLFIPKAGGGMITPWPQHLVAMPIWPSHTFMQVDPLYLLHHVVVIAPLFFYFLCGEFFGTLSSLIGTAGAAGLIREDGTIPKATRAFAADATATIVGPLFDGVLLHRSSHGRTRRWPYRSGFGRRGGAVCAVGLLLAADRDHSAAGHRAFTGDGRRTDAARPRAGRHERLRRGAAGGADAAADRADE